MRQRPPLSEALIRQVIAEDPRLAEAGERYLARQMGPPKGLRGVLPLPGHKLKSVVTSVASITIDQPLLKESTVLEPLKPISIEVVLIEDKTNEEVPEAAEMPLASTEAAIPEEGNVSVTNLRILRRFLLTFRLWRCIQLPSRGQRMFLKVWLKERVPTRGVRSRDLGRPLLRRPLLRWRG